MKTRIYDISEVTRILQVLGATAGHRISREEPQNILMVQDCLFYCCDNVYPGARESTYLARNLVPPNRGYCLDLCTGMGLFAVLLAIRGLKTVAVDISAEAVQCATANAKMNRVEELLSVRQGSLFEPIKDEAFDYIVCSPPQLPTPEILCSGDLWGIAVDGGHNGRKIIDLIIPEIYDHLRPSGIFQMIQSNLAGIEQTLAALNSEGLQASIMSEIWVPLGRTTRERVAYFQSRGLLPKDQPLRQLFANIVAHRPITAGVRNL